jgi:hypothetical protein
MAERSLGYPSHMGKADQDSDREIVHGTSEDGLESAVSSAPKRPRATKRRIGFMKGQYTVPDDIKTPFAAEIEEMFYGGDIFPPESGKEDL